MFCPKCGQPDQTPESYCRQCGTYLPDLSKPAKTSTTPEVHFKANIVLTVMTIVTCITLAILLWSMLAFRPDTHPLIYVTAGLMMAMSIWHVQTLWRTLLLRKHFKRTTIKRELKPGAAQSTDKLLDPADLENIVPASVTERTTRHSTADGRRSAEPKHQADRAV